MYKVNTKGLSISIKKVRRENKKGTATTFQSFDPYIQGWYSELLTPYIIFLSPFFYSRKVNEAKELEENSTILSAEFFSYKEEA